MDHGGDAIINISVDVLQNHYVDLLDSHSLRTAPGHAVSIVLRFFSVLCSCGRLQNASRRQSTPHVQQTCR